jgi:tetratricopeptide (TPR) repeat protein
MCAHGQAAKLSGWTTLCAANQCEAAKQLCTPFTESADVAEKVEAHKCLANVALCGHGVIQLHGDETDGAESFQPAAIDEAIKHLNTAIQLAPQELSLHEERLHILEETARFDAMVKALDESSGIYTGGDALTAWLVYAQELSDLRQFQAALAFMKVLDKHYPSNPNVVGNIGSFLAMLQKNSEAIPYLQKAVELAPTDPVNPWDLGRAYDYAGQFKQADLWYQKSIALDTDADRHKQNACQYAIFVETRLNNRSRACTLEKKDCPADEQTACGGQ